MSRNLRRHLLRGTALTLFAMAWCAGAPAFAQDGAESDEIIVTAQKREENVLDVGISVQALSQDTLEERGIDQLRDLGNALPNVTVKEQIPGAIPVITIRGVGLDDFSSTNNPAAGIYVDEVPLSSLALMSFDFYDLQRVEVVRGPQGTLYGRNSTAGAINVLSARPADHFEARLAGGYGAYERAEAEAMLNMPLGQNAAFRVAGRYVNQGEGFWQSRIGTDRNIGEQDVLQARAQLSLALSPAWDVNFKVEGLRSRSEMGYGEHFGTVGLGCTPINLPCSRSSVLARRFTTGEHGVEDDDELSHDGGGYEFEGFALGSEPLGEGAQTRIEAHGCDGGHVKSAPDRRAARLDVSGAFHLAAIARDWRKPCKTGSFAFAHGA